MSNLQTGVKDICRLADAVIKDPFTDIDTTAANIGVSATIANIAVAGSFLPFIPFTIKKLIKKKEQRQEKERMLREIIRKQQKVNNELKQKLAKSREQNAKNRKEIENLKEILRMLETTKCCIKWENINIQNQSRKL